MKDNFFWFVLLDLIVKIWEYLKSKSIQAKAAASSFIFGCSLLAVSWQQLAIEKFFSLSSGSTGTNPSWGASEYGGCALLFVGVLFWIWACFVTKKPNKEEIVQHKKISPAHSVFHSRVFCYCGSIKEISDIDVVVTSENTDFELGGRRSISVSGRLRSMAATYGDDRTIISDNLDEWVRAWKTDKNKLCDFNLGHCVPCDSVFEASKYGIKKIIFAIAIRKNDTDTATIERDAIQDIVNQCVKHCLENGYKSMFIPVFGLGKGNVPRSLALQYTLESIHTSLKNCNSSLDVFIGVYRTLDLIKMGTLIRKWK